MNTKTLKMVMFDYVFFHYVHQHVNRLLSKIKLFYMKCMKMKNEFLWSLGIFFSFDKEIFYPEPRPWDGVAMK